MVLLLLSIIISDAVLVRGEGCREESLAVGVGTDSDSSAVTNSSDRDPAATCRH